MKEENFLKSHNLDTHTHTGEIRKLHTRPIGHQNESDGPKTKSFFCELLRKKWRIPFRSSPNLRWEFLKENKKSRIRSRKTERNMLSTKKATKKKEGRQSKTQIIIKHLS